MKTKKTKNVLTVQGKAPLIAKCALRFPSNWYANPGETKRAIYRADVPWRVHGIRFGSNASKLQLLQVKTGGFDNLVEPMSAKMFGPLFSDAELRAIANSGPTGIVLDVPYTGLVERIRVMDPDHWLECNTLAGGDDLEIVVKNVGTVPEIIEGALFFSKPWESVP